MSRTADHPITSSARAPGLIGQSDRKTMGNIGFGRREVRLLVGSN